MKYFYLFYSFFLLQKSSTEGFTPTGTEKSTTKHNFMNLSDTIILIFNIDFKTFSSHHQGCNGSTQTQTGFLKVDT